MEPNSQTKEPTRRLDLKVGYTCNNNCLFCVVGHMKGAHRDFSTQEIKDIMSHSRESFNDVVMTGGEFTIRKDCLELLRHARKLNYHINVQTNGRMLSYKTFCKEFVDAAGPKLSFLISPHSADENIHNSLTRTDSWKQTVKSIALLLEMKQLLGTNSVITKMNYKGIPDLAKMLAAMGVKFMTFAFVQAMGNAEKNIDMILPRKSDVAPYVKKGLQIGIDNGVGVAAESLPPCFLTGGYEHCTNELFSPPVRSISKDRVIEDFITTRKTVEKIKGPNCKRCIYCNFCEGPRRQYPEYYGWSEFIPIE